MLGRLFKRRQENRRKYQRCPTRLRATAEYGELKRTGSIVDFSQGGCLFKPDDRGFHPERQIDIVVGGQRLKARIVRESARGIHLSWLFSRKLEWARRCEICETAEGCPTALQRIKDAVRQEPLTASLWHKKRDEAS